MNDEITIGLILPTSSIVPMSKDFEKGLKNELKDVSRDIEIVKEYVGNGDDKKTQEACQKLIAYDDARIITGILNNRVVNILASKFENKNTVLIANSAGEVWPNIEKLNSNIFLNSYQAWERVWALSHWASGEFGKNGMFVTGIFDSGFSFVSAFDQGLLSYAEDTKWSFAVAPAPGAHEGLLAEVDKVFPLIEEKEPDFIFAAFCGEEAALFLDLYEQSPFFNRIPLISLPYLIEPCKRRFEKPLTIHTAMSCSEGMEQEMINPLLWKKEFYQLGRETGKMIALALESGDDIAKALSKISIDAGRGIIRPIPSLSNNMKVHRSQVSYTGELASTSVVQKGGIDSTDINAPEIAKLAQEISSGWYNPYLAI